MQPATAKHAPRVDEAMADDVASLVHGAPVESRSDGARLQEDPGVGAGQRAADHDAPGLGISEADADRRAELARHLASAAFPATAAQLVFTAEEAHAPPGVVSALRRLPDDASYETVQAVWEALGGPTEGTHT